MYYVVTEYWNNGESWEDEHHSEKPIAVYKTLGEIRENIPSGFTDLKLTDTTYSRHIYACEQKEYDTSDPYDQSWIEYRVYLVGDEID